MKTPRQIALEAGEVRYFTGRPCSKGHVAERYTGSCSCVPCGVQSSARHLPKWAAKNPARYREIRANARDKCDRLRPEKRRERTKRGWDKYRKNNPEKTALMHRATESRRRARKKAAGGTFSVEEIYVLHKRQRGKCPACKASIADRFDIDHIVAIACGGGNDISNIQLLCPPCNRSKGCKDAIVWAQENGALL